MKTRAIVLAGLLVGIAAAAKAQDNTTTTQQETTQSMQSSEGGQTTTTTKTTTISGSVVKYEPGHTIVIREPNRKVVTYTLSPSVELPGDIAVGKKVTVYAEPGEGGSTTVTRVTTVGMGSDGSMNKTTETQSMDSEGNMTTKTKTTRVYGTVDAYDAGKSITLTNANGEKVTYTITEKSHLPAAVTVGKKVTVYTTTVGGQPTVQRMTTSTTTHTKHTVKTDAQ